MCQNAQKTVVTLLTEIEPSLVALGNITGLSNSPVFQTVLNEYNIALGIIKNWQPGTPAQEAIEAINALEQAMQSLPIPAQYQVLVNIILAGIATVLGVLGANSPASVPKPVDATASDEETQAQHQATVIHETTVKVQALVPGFKRSIWHSAANQYKSAWNSAVTEGGFDASLALQ